MENPPTDPLIVNPIQPYQARKAYACPGCSGDIAPGEGHLVVVPEHEPGAAPSLAPWLLVQGDAPLGDATQPAAGSQRTSAPAGPTTTPT